MGTDTKNGCIKKENIMKLKIENFKGMDSKVLKVCQLKTIDVKTGLKAIQQDNLRELLEKAFEVVSNLEKTHKDTLKVQGKVEKVYFMLEKVDELGLDNLYIKMLSKEIIKRGKKEFQFDYMDVYELEFLPKQNGDTLEIHVIFNEYSVVPGLNTEKQVFRTYLTQFEFKEGTTFYNLDEATLKLALGKDKDGKKLEKVKTLFELNPYILDKNNINTLVKDTEDFINGQLELLTASIESKMKAVDIIGE